MKVIELLTKISCNDDVPEYITFCDKTTGKTNIMLVCEENIIHCLNNSKMCLNDDVEEFKPVIDKLKHLHYLDYNCEYDDCKLFYYFNSNFKILSKKMNEIIEYLQEFDCE